MANLITIINIHNHQQADLEVLQADPQHYIIQGMEPT